MGNHVDHGHDQGDLPVFGKCVDCDGDNYSDCDWLHFMYSEKLRTGYLPEPHWQEKDGHC